MILISTKKYALRILVLCDYNSSSILNIIFIFLTNFVNIKAFADPFNIPTCIFLFTTNFYIKNIYGMDLPSYFMYKIVIFI